MKYLKRFIQVQKNYKSIYIYGVLCAILISILKIIEYHYTSKNITTDLYIGILSLFFTSLGIWMGLRFIKKKDTPKNTETFQLNTDDLKKYAISQREYEVLILISKGMSNKEIAETLFISITTVKTHTSHLFEKLNVERRTQAIHKSKMLKLIP